MSAARAIFIMHSPRLSSFLFQAWPSVEENFVLYTQKAPRNAREEIGSRRPFSEGE